MSKRIVFGNALADEDLLRPLTESYRRFVQMDVAPEKRTPTGLHAAFTQSFPFRSPTGRFELSYESYTLERPTYDAPVCLDRGIDYAAPLKVLVRLTEYADVESRVTANVKEQELYMGEVPLMVDGAFVSWGERRHLIPRVLGVWLPRDGRPALATRHTMLPGEWLELAIWEGLVSLKKDVEKLLAKPDKDFTRYMPHDFIESRRVSIAIRTLMRDQRRSARLDRGNPLAQLDRLVGSVAEALVPFAGDERERAAGARAQNEALVPVEPEPARTTTGIETAIARDAALVRLAPFDAEVELVDPDTMILWPTAAAAADNEPASPRDALVFLRRFVGSASEREVDTPCATSGERVSAGDIVALSDGAALGTLALGREALVVFDRSATRATVSDDFAAKMATKRVARYEGNVRDTFWGMEKLEAVVQLGEHVRAGMPLVGISTWSELPRNEKEQRALQARYPRYTPEERMLRAIMGEKTDAPPRVDGSVRVKKGGDGVVVAVHVFSSPGRDEGEDQRARGRARVAGIRAAAERRGGSFANSVADHAEGELRHLLRQDELPPGVRIFVRVTVERTVPLARGDTLTDRRGRGAPVGKIVPKSEMPRLGGEHVDVVLPPSDASGLREARLSHAGRILDERYVGAPTDAEIDAICKRAGLTSGAEAAAGGALYLMRRR